MPLKQKKQQQKRAKKAAKRKTIVAAKKAAEGGSRLLGAARAMATVATSPIHECLMSEMIFEQGIGTVIISRRLPDGRIGAALFLVDAYCLGIKNADFSVLFREEYNERVTLALQNEILTEVEPACARKIVEEAVAYAKDLGFEPHKDYQLAKRIMGDIDPAACSTQFTFGKDGKLFFITGPNDTPKKVEKIVNTLTKRYGPGGFDYLVGIGGPMDFGDFEETEMDFEEIQEDAGQDTKIVFQDDEDVIEVEFEKKE
jgi:hypothetical protein